MINDVLNIENSNRNMCGRLIFFMYSASVLLSDKNVISLRHRLEFCKQL